MLKEEINLLVELLRFNVRRVYSENSGALRYFLQFSSFNLSAFKFAFLGRRWRFLDFDLTGFKRV